MTATAVVVLGAGGFAVADIPEQDGTINGCYSDATGALRITESAGDCRSNETPISFAQQGEKGDAGPVGPQGETGPTGAQGAKGDKGDTGEMGPTGPQGAKGDDGAQGPAGRDAPAVAKPHQFEVGRARIFTSAQDDVPTYEFDLYGFKQGYENLGSTQTGGGSGSGKAQISDALLTKRFTPETTRLWHDLVTGRHFDRVVVELRRGQAVDATFTYEDVLLTQSAHSVGEGGLEKLSLASARHATTFANSIPAGHDGGSLLFSDQTTTGFDGFAWAATQSAVPTTGGMVAGRANLGSFTVDGDLDGATRRLFEAVTTGQRMHEARLTLTSLAPAHAYVLRDVMVTGLEISSDGRAASAVPQRSVTMDAARITQSQSPASAFGSRCYDRMTDRTC